MHNAVLDMFGKSLVRNVRDEAIDEWRMIVSGHMKSQRAQELRDRLSALSEQQQNLFLSIVPEVVDTVLHHLLRWLEEEEDIKVSVTTDGDVTSDIRDVSDGLAGELYSEAGWIARFGSAES